MTVGSFLADHWGDLASVAGLGAATWAAIKAKAAADAAQEVKLRIGNLDALEELAAAIATIGEIKRLQRAKSWDLVLDRYAFVRKHLVRVREMQAGAAHGSKLGDAINQFRIMEGKVEREKDHPGIDPAEINRIAAEQADNLERIVIAIKQSGA